MGSIGSIKDILSIKIKTRHDSYTDQFIRIFMSKMFINKENCCMKQFKNLRIHCTVETLWDEYLNVCKIV